MNEGAPDLPDPQAISLLAEGCPGEDWTIVWSAVRKHFITMDLPSNIAFSFMAGLGSFSFLDAGAPGALLTTLLGNLTRSGKGRTSLWEPGTLGGGLGSSVNHL